MNKSKQMEITASKSYIQIKIDTNEIDLETLMEQINNVPKVFRNYLIDGLGISIEALYHKKRNKSFKLLECQKLTELTGLNADLL